MDYGFDTAVDLRMPVTNTYIIVTPAYQVGVTPSLLAWNHY